MLKKTDALKGIKLFVLDMDGTVYLGEKPIDGSLDFIQKISCSQNLDFIFFTNNASKVSKVYVEKLAKMGINVKESKIITAGDVCAKYLQIHFPNAKILLNGTPILEANWREKGLNLVNKDPDVCVQSFDTSLTYDKLDKICHYVRNGVPFIATHMDTNCPTEYGFMPDCGAMCSLITDSTGVKPKFLGKPFSETIDMIMEITGFEKNKIAFVGDRIYTDVATGVNNGAKGFLVLSGESNMKTVLESNIEPTCIYDSLGEMANYLET